MVPRGRVVACRVLKTSNLSDVKGDREKRQIAELADYV